MTMRRLHLAQLGAKAAADLDRRGYQFAGIVRQMAQELATLPPDVLGDACLGCAADLDQPETGRRRKWCSDACRQRHNRKRTDTSS